MRIKTRHWFQFFFLLPIACLAVSDASAAKLQQETVKAWNEYIRVAEARISRELKSTEVFRAADHLDPETARFCKESLSEGEICVLNMQESGNNDEVDIPDGKVHHWLGTALIRGAKIGDVIEWVQNYDRHEDYYDDVEKSQLISRKGNFFRIFLRLKRKKVITVHYNTNHDVHYYPQGTGKLYSSSIATRIREIDNPGEADEQEKPEGNDNGFLWRLNSYWRFKQVDDGVIVDCESMSLSRSAPIAVKWMVKSYINSVPRESLENALAPIREELAGTSEPLREP